MSWESPKLSKGDIEMLTLILEDYNYYAKQDGGSVDIEDSDRLLIRLEDHLNRF